MGCVNSLGTSCIWSLQGLQCKRVKAVQLTGLSPTSARPHLCKGVSAAGTGQLQELPLVLLLISTILIGGQLR